MTTSTEETQLNQLINFLQEDLDIPADSVSLVVKYCEQTINWLPTILWQHKLVTLGQLDQVFDWLERHHSLTSSMPAVHDRN